MPIRHSSTARDSRSMRGLHIALNLTIKHTYAGWIVPSQSGKGKYVVSLELDQCTCPDFEHRGQKCKHIFAVEHKLEGLEDVDEEPESETSKARVTYSQPWHEYNRAQTNEKANFQILLHDLCQGISEPPQDSGRRRLPLSDMVVRCGVQGLYRAFRTPFHERL